MKKLNKTKKNDVSFIYPEYKLDPCQHDLVILDKLNKITLLKCQLCDKSFSIDMEGNLKQLVSRKIKEEEI